MQVRRQQGYTLTELLVVIAILAIVAAVATNDLTSDDQSKLDAATADVVGVFRFAHSEAIRTGESHGVHADKFDQRLRVYRLDTSGGLPVIRYDIYDPLTKLLYEIQFSSAASDRVIAEAHFSFVGADAPSNYLGFAGGTGVPADADIGKLRMLEEANVRLTHGDDSRLISISPMTGRVTVQ